MLSSKPKPKSKSRHPPPEGIHRLWQIFVDNVDPLTKVVHVPTLRPAIQKAASNTATLPRGFEALMFAIYSVAVMSLKDDECKQLLYESRTTLLSRYVSATKAALSRAKFMGTISLVVLQALVLHLMSVRDIYEPRTVWSLTGVALRIAQGMGLERDGLALGVPPFETELRRRIWWLLKSHDYRTAELCGLAKFRDYDSAPEATQGPININDDQLFPGMQALPAESDELTDAIFVAVRRDFQAFAAGRIARFKEQGKSPANWELRVSGPDQIEIDEAFKAMEESLETKYLRYCDPSNPVSLDDLNLNVPVKHHTLKVLLLLFLTNDARLLISIIVASRHNADHQISHEQHTFYDAPSTELAQRRADAALRASIRVGCQYQTPRTARHVAIQLYSQAVCMACSVLAALARIDSRS